MISANDFRNRETAKALATEIRRLAEERLGGRPVKLMEVCGGHTISIFKYGIRHLLPSNIELLSGPGCPVCVTHNRFIDTAIELSRIPNVVITTFGDMIRVPGSRSSLAREKAEGADVRICYSTLDALEIARKDPTKQVIFLGIGFETTAPTIAAAIRDANTQGLANFSVLSALKTMPHALRALIKSGELALNGLICPGHVSAITGSSIYDFIANEYRTPCVISGFEPLDLLQSIQMLLQQLAGDHPQVQNQYGRAAPNQGNPIARALLNEIFVESDTEWRGLGVIPQSGLAIAPKYARYDAEKRFSVQVPPSREHPGCLCGPIMRGVRTPCDCPLFGKACTPEHPIGSCMVSDEGSCATYFRYGEKRA